MSKIDPFTDQSEGHRREPGGDPPVELLHPRRRCRRSRGVHRRPRHERGAHHRRFRRVVPPGPSRKPGSRGEILIVDSSTDRTAELALAGGARVLRTPKRGLGRAYIDAAAVHPRSLRRHGRRRLHLRLPPGRLVRREAAARATSSPWAPGGCGSIEARLHARAAPVLRNARSQPGSSTGSIGSRLHRHPLRDAGHQPRCPAAHGPVVAVVGVRLGDGAQVGADGAADRARCRSPSTRTATGGCPTTNAPAGSRPFQAAWINLRAMFIYRAEFFVLKPGL